MGNGKNGERNRGCFVAEKWCSPRIADLVVPEEKLIRAEFIRPGIILCLFLVV